VEAYQPVGDDQNRATIWQEKVLTPRRGLRLAGVNETDERRALKRKHDVRGSRQFGVANNIWQ
jgi:hypothetical protein